MSRLPHVRIPHPRPRCQRLRVGHRIQKRCGPSQPRRLSGFQCQPHFRAHKPAMPVRMPPCPNGRYICTWFSGSTRRIAEDSRTSDRSFTFHGVSQGDTTLFIFHRNVTGISNVFFAKPLIARRCGGDPDFRKPSLFLETVFTAQSSHSTGSRMDLSMSVVLAHLSAS